VGILTPGRDRLRSGGVGLGGCAPIQGPVGPDGVVVGGEPLQFALQRSDRFRWGLRGKPLLLGLLEPLHFAADLRVVGPGVITPDPEHAEFDLQSDPALAALFAGEDRPIEFLTDVKLRRLV
jgi:hypothetical protein